MSNPPDTGEDVREFRSLWLATDNPYAVGPVDTGHRISYISPSALTTYTEGCPRAWAFKGIARLPVVQGPAQVFGEELHKEIETFLLTGRAPNQNTKAGRLATTCIPHLPPSQTSDMYVEKELFYAVGETAFAPVARTGHIICECGHVFEVRAMLCPKCGAQYDAVIGGKVDVLSPALDHLPKVTDHKSCSCYPSDYALTSATLPKNPQGFMYGLFACTVYRTEASDLQWNYASKSQNTCTPVRAVITKADALARVRGYLPVLREMTTFKKTLDRSPERVIEECHKVRANPDVCLAYNRTCDFSAHCRDFALNPKEYPPMSMTEIQSRLAQLRGETPPATEAPTPAAVVTPPTPAAAVTPPTVADQSVAVNPPEAAVALVETAAEIAGTTPAAPPETPTEPAKKGRGKAAAPTPPAVGAQDALAQLREIAKATGCKITVTFEP